MVSSDFDLVTTTILAIPLSRYLAWIMDGKYQPPRLLRWFEERLNSGPQDWKQYTVALLIFNTVLFVFGFIVLALQPWMPLNPHGRACWRRRRSFNTVISFMTNTNLQHYSGDVHFSNFSQIFFVIANCSSCPRRSGSAPGGDHPRASRRQDVGNFFVDMWRVVIYMFVPAAFVVGVVFLQQGMPMTFESAVQVSTLEPGAMGTTDNGQAKQQTIVVGPVAAFVPIKQLGTNGGGFYGMNSAHPFENPTALTNFLRPASP